MKTIVGQLIAGQACVKTDSLVWLQQLAGNDL